MSQGPVETTAVIITLKDLYTEFNSTTRENYRTLAELNSTLTRMLTRMENSDAQNLAYQKSAERQHDDIESRVRALERWRYALPTSVALGVASAIITAIGVFVHH